MTCWHDPVVIITIGSGVAVIGVTGSGTNY